MFVFSRSPKLPPPSGDVKLFNWFLGPQAVLSTTLGGGKREGGRSFCRRLQKFRRKWNMYFLTVALSGKGLMTLTLQLIYFSQFSFWKLYFRYTTFTFLPIFSCSDQQRQRRIHNPVKHLRRSFFRKQFAPESHEVFS